MRVAKYYNNRDVRLEEMPKPVIGKDELLVRVWASGICGSDVMEWYRIKKAPLVLGHEIAGEIVEAGSDVKRYRIGQRVFVAHHVPCNSCHYCLHGDHTVCQTLHTTNYDPGGFSEYIRIPKLNVDRGTFLLPDQISYEQGTFIEPLACVIRGQRMAGLEPGRSVLILGAGISGLLHLLLAAAKGAGEITITDVNEYRLKVARSLGATAAINAKDVFKDNRCFDSVIICTSALSAFMQALQAVDRAGVILCFAPTGPGITLPVPVNDFWRQSIKIIHSYGSSPQDTKEAIKILGAGCVSVDKLITHRLGLKDAGLGFRLVTEAKDCIKVIIEPQKA